MVDKNYYELVKPLLFMKFGLLIFMLPVILYNEFNFLKVVVFLIVGMVLFRYGYDKLSETLYEWTYDNN